MATSVKLQGTGLYQDTTVVLDGSTDGQAKFPLALSVTGTLGAQTVAALGAISTAGALTADNIVCTNAATFGGGFGATGVTIATDGAISANGLASLDGGINVNDDFTVDTDGIVDGGTWQAGVIASAYLDADTAHLSTNQTFSGTKTFSAEAQLDAGFDVNNSKLAVSTAGKLVTVDNVNAQAILTSHNINCSGSLLIGDSDIVLNGTAVTSTGAELNLVDGSAANTVRASKAVIYGASGQVKATTLTTTSNASISGSLHVVGDLDVQGAINSVTRTETSLEIEDKTILVASGSSVSDSDGAGMFFGGYGHDQTDSADDSHAAILWDNGHSNLQLMVGGAEIAQVSAGAFAVTGTLNASGDAVIGNDLSLASDSVVLSFGADGDTTLTHTDGTGLTLNSTNKLCFGRAATLIQESSANNLMIGAAASITAASPTVAITATTAMTINDGSNTAKLKINGASTVLGLNLPNTATTGDAIANSWSTYSDASLKKDITPIENALEKVMSMKGVSYEYKSGGGRKVGFLAQDMQQVVPEVVKSMTQTDDKDLLCISYDQLTSVLVEAVKAQQTQIEDLKSVVVKLSDNS